MILQPPSTLLTGPTGTGKTSAIITYLLRGLRVFVVVTEPDKKEALAGVYGKGRATMLEHRLAAAQTDADRVPLSWAASKLARPLPPCSSKALAISCTRTGKEITFS